MFINRIHKTFLSYFITLSIIMVHKNIYSILASNVMLYCFLCGIKISILLMIFYEDNGQNLKSCCILQTKKFSSFWWWKIFCVGAACLPYFTIILNFAMKSQQNLSVFCKTDKQCVCAFNTNRKKIREISKPLSSVHSGLCSAIKMCVPSGCMITSKATKTNVFWNI